MKRLIPLLLVLALVAVACGGGSPVGKWYHDDGGYIELTKDGDVMVGEEGFTMPFGSWEQNRGKIEIHYFGMVVLEGSVSGNRLTLWDPDDPSDKEVFTKGR